MEILGGIVIGFLALVLLAGVGLAALLGLTIMALLGLLTDMSFKKLFFVSFGLGLLAPILIGSAISGAIADGSVERDLRDDLAGVVQLPPDMGEQWGEALPQLQEISREVDQGNLTEAEAEERVRQIFSQFEDIQIGIDVDGDGVVEGDNGVPLDIPEAVPAEVSGDSEGN